MFIRLVNQIIVRPFLKKFHIRNQALSFQSQSAIQQTRKCCYFSTEKHMIKQREEQLIRLHSLYRSHQQNGRYSLARDALRKSAQIVKDIHGQYHLMYSEILQAIGMIYAKEKKFDLAIESIIKCNNIVQKYPDSDSSVAYLNGLIGKFYHAMERYDQAYKYLKESMHFINNYQDQEKIANIYCCYGDVLQKRQNFQEAVEAYQYVLQLSQKKSQAISYTSVYFSLGQCYSALGRFPQSLAAFYKFAEIKFAEEQETSEKTLFCLLIIGKIYQEIQDIEKRMEFYEKCMKLAQRFKGKNSPTVFYFIQTLGQTYLEGNMHGKCIEHLEKYVAVQNKPLEGLLEIAGHMKNLVNLGTAYQFQFKYQQAIHYYRLVLKGYEEHKINDMPALTAAGRIGKIMFNTKNMEQSLKYLLKFLEIQEKVEINHPYQFDIYNSIIQIHLILRNHEEAKKYIDIVMMKSKKQEKK